MSTNGQLHHGSVIKDLIKNSRYSVEQVAQRIEIGRTTMYKLFKQKVLSPSLLRDIGRILNVDMASIVPGYIEIIANEPEVEYKKPYIVEITKESELREALFQCTVELNEWKEKYYKKSLELMELRLETSTRAKESNS